MNTKYILDGKTPKHEPDLMAWARWFENADRLVAEYKFEGGRISTVFLGLDHQFGEGPPLIFETLVFGGKLADEMERTSTWEEAEQAHERMVQKVVESTL